VTRRWQLFSIGASTALRAVLAAAGIGLVLIAPARAQVSSEGKGTLTLEVGHGSAPGGSIATQVVDQATTASHVDAHANGFRLVAGYHFAEQLTVEVGLAHLGSLASSAPYLGTDRLSSSSSMIVVEGDLVANIPVAPRARFDFTAGATVTGLHTTLSTLSGSGFPPGVTGDQNVRRFGATVGADFEWRLGDVTSIIIGYHFYNRVGSSRLLDSQGGNASGIFGGMHFEF
jgi:hypothetical protein